MLNSNHKIVKTENLSKARKIKIVHFNDIDTLFADKNLSDGFIQFEYLKLIILEKRSKKIIKHS